MYKVEKQRANKFSVRNAVLIISVFLMIYMSSSYNITVISGTITMAVCLCCGLFVILAGGKNKISQQLLLSVILLCCCVLITSLIAGDSMKDAIIMISAILISMLFVFGLDYKKYCEIYTNVILIIAVYSLVAYILSIIAPSIIRLFPDAYYRPGLETYNLGLTFVNLRTNLIRNMGIFWEPGAYQAYLVFAILIELFSLKTTRRYALIAYALALITTWSTTGIINGLILLLIFIIYKNKNSKMKSAKIITTITILAIIIVSIYSILPYNIQYAAIGKITVYLASSNTNISSASVRLDSIIYPLRAYLSSPIIGVGYSSLGNSILAADHTMTTATPINWFAAYGIVFGLLCCIAVFRFARKLNNSPLLLILIIFTILLSISTEQYLRNISIIVFLLYGLSEPAHGKLTREKVERVF